MPSLLAIYRTVAANQWHREGEEMIQPRQAQERVGKRGREEKRGAEEKRAIEVGGSGGYRGWTVLLESINQTSRCLVNWDKRGGRRKELIGINLT